MTDHEFLEYMYWHCRTELGEFHKDHVRRLLILAHKSNSVIELEASLLRADMREFWQLGPGFIDPLVASARKAVA